MKIRLTYLVPSTYLYHSQFKQKQNSLKIPNMDHNQSENRHDFNSNDEIAQKTIAMAPQSGLLAC